MYNMSAINLYVEFTTCVQINETELVYFGRAYIHIPF